MGLCEQTDDNVDTIDEVEEVQSEQENDDALNEVPCSYCSHDRAMCSSSLLSRSSDPVTITGFHFGTRG